MITWGYGNSILSLALQANVQHFRLSRNYNATWITLAISMKVFSSNWKSAEIVRYSSVLKVKYTCTILRAHFDENKTEAANYLVTDSKLDNI